jgi:hypothetical protein
MKTAIQAELPEQLVAEARVFVDQGWVGNFDELLATHSSRRTWPGGCVAENEPATSIILGCR